MYTIGLFHVTNTLDINGRAEWFDDAKGTRTGIETNYAEVTGGINWHPLRWLEFRPEIRGDFAVRRPSGEMVPIIIATC